jgi:pantoate--beta-alanine ligase
MTMGGLHAGHRKLIEVAREHADSVVVTIFVNPLQFGPGEDFGRYPRELESDLAICAREGVDVVFAPAVDGIYPPGEDVPVIHAGDLGARLEGAARPAHFDGVLTVVARLLELTRADLAVFGEKDAQQLELIRRMVAERGLPVEIVPIAIVREPDGLALSSRNRYLSHTEREAARGLSRALRIAAGNAGRRPEALVADVRAALAAEPAIELDYVAAVDDATWRDPDESTQRVRILVAARVGTTRLIDNASIAIAAGSSAEQSLFTERNVAEGA